MRGALNHSLEATTQNAQVLAMNPTRDDTDTDRAANAQANLVIVDRRDAIG